MSAPQNITAPSDAAAIAERAARATDDNFHHRLAHALAGSTWTEAECVAFRCELSPEAVAYLHFHFAPIIQRNVHLSSALSMDAAQLAELIEEHRFDWDRR